MRIAALAVGCALWAPALGEAPAPPRTLTIAAAANVRAAAEALERAFEARRPDVRVALTLGASGTFFAQLQSGAPYDLFLSADREYPARLIRAGLASAADERVYAVGELVAWVPAGSALDLERRGLAALADPAVKRIALANPAVAPFGRATEAALRSAGVLGAVQGRLVLGTSVAQAAQWATAGAADVAFLPRALALAPALAGGRIYRVPASLYPRIEQSGIVLAAARQPALAREFLAFVTGAEGRALLARYGYGLP